MVFLKITSFLTAEELEAIKLIRFGRKKNTDLLFIFVIPEHFKGCISGRGADVTLTEPLTREKLSIVVKCWKMCFSNTVKKENSARPKEHGSPLLNSYGEHLGCFSTDVFTRSESLRNDIGLEFKVPLSEFEKSKQMSFLHSSKEKLRRERIKYCCEQLRILLPYIKGRKNDSASILEATVDYVKYVREKIPPAAMRQITEALQSNTRFSKKQMPIQLSLPCTVKEERENNALASTYSPVRGIQFLANKRLNVYSLPTAGASLDEPVRGLFSGQLQEAREQVIQCKYKSHHPICPDPGSHFWGLKSLRVLIQARKLGLGSEEDAGRSLGRWCVLEDGASPHVVVAAASTFSGSQVPLGTARRLMYTLVPAALKACGKEMAFYS
ncbi:Spermatogenesis- and oogenesis-specific basic helix-loop-helix-containing protein 2 [Fukomys damarensis]|uniref:Spermatogenesis- and oogenesis-specific basic helix-loop-helix-containing protein 2 n=1 Tax=Fukomys damarensis TaxID=885580 RepID=A0A091DSX0_FUKDA|nr:Spermatogenesis- and oogenesis-specific basic helix-loop-helix-containing protein 2 [Fukomys damarensis]